eukprot:990012-Karenia_brevis.AAC.1
MTVIVMVMLMMVMRMVVSHWYRTPHPKPLTQAPCCSLPSFTLLEPPHCRNQCELITIIIVI